MSAGPRRVEPARATRPRNRRAMIMSAAADLFHRVGYDRVGMNDIALAVGITGGALYRHFASKQQLLGETILDRFDQFDRAVAATEELALDDAMRALVGYGLDHRELGVLWQRESRRLSDATREALRHQLSAMTGQVVQRVLAERADVDPARAEVLVWAAFGVTASPSYSKLELGRPQLDELVGSLAVTALHAELPARTDPPRQQAPEPGRSLLAGRVSRREELLDAAVSLFARQGFPSVTLDDIGAEVGIAGPSLYNHFTSKLDLLDAAVTRGGHWLQLGLTQALASTASPEQALDNLVRAYLDLALGFSDLIDVLVNELGHLPVDRRRYFTQLLRDYLAEWVRLLSVRRPEMSPAELRVLARALLIMVNNIARTRHLRSEPGLPDALFGICSALLRLDA